MDETWLVVGLGNPGESYRKTRHNLGFAVVDELASRHRLELRTQKFRARFGKGRISGRPVLLSKPQTYMNRSGQSVGVMAGWHRIPAERVVVVHDDLDLTLGRMKLKAGGGHGGHNGLRDIKTALGSSEFLRVRLGIGRPDGQDDASDHVLSSFRPEERELIEPIIGRAADATEAILADGVRTAMNVYNTRGEG
jgi:peptidyl-tRNA hydrolase, PTH1 family